MKRTNNNNGWSNDRFGLKQKANHPRCGVSFRSGDGRFLSPWFKSPIAMGFRTGVRLYLIKTFLVVPSLMRMMLIPFVGSSSLRPLRSYQFPSPTGEGAGVRLMSVGVSIQN